MNDTSGDKRGLEYLIGLLERITAEGDPGVIDSHTSSTAKTAINVSHRHLEVHCCQLPLREEEKKGISGLKTAHTPFFI